MWTTVTLGEVVSFIRGLTYSKKDEVDIGGLAVLRATNISLEQRKIVYDEIRHIRPPEKINEDKLAKVGDLLMCTASGSKSHLGKVALVTEDLGMAFGGFMAALRCNPSCSPKFLFYVLTSNLFIKKLSSISEGANINNLKFSQIEDFEFQLPPLAEQQRIVAKLDAAFAEIDEMSVSVITTSKYLETLRIQSINEIIVKNSTEIITKPLHALFKLSSGKFLSKKQMQDDGDVKVYGGNGVAGTHNVSNLEGQNVLIGRVGAKCGNVHFVNENIWLTDNAMYVHSLQDEFDLEFLTIILASLSLGSYARQAAQPVISFSSIKDVAVSFPLSLEEQNVIVKELHKFDASIGALDNVYGCKAKQLRALKAAILAQELQSEAA